MHRAPMSFGLMTGLVVGLLGRQSGLQGQEENAAWATVQKLKQAVVRVVAREPGFLPYNPDRVAHVWRLPYGFSDIKDIDKLAKDCEAAQRIAFAFHRPITVDFFETPIEDALKLLSAKTGVPMKADPEAIRRQRNERPTVTLRVRNVPIKPTLGFILPQCGLECAIFDGTVFLSDESGLTRRSCMLQSDSPAVGSLLLEILRQPATVHFEKTPVRDAIDQISSKYFKGVSFAVDLRALPQDRRFVTLNVDNAPLAAALSRILHSAGMQMCVVRDVVVFCVDPQAVTNPRTTNVARAEDFAFARFPKDFVKIAKHN